MAYGDWRDNLKPASYRGVPFVVSSDETTYGRKTIRHDFLNKEFPFVEDVGRLPSEFKIDAILVGSDYADNRDALIAEYDVVGGGILVHPHYGRIIVTPTQPLSITHSKTDGQMCTVSMSFVHTDPSSITTPANDKFTDTIASAGKSLETTAGAFDKIFTIAGKISGVIASANTAVTKAIDAVKAVKAQAQKLSKFQQLTGRLIANVNTLMLTPHDLAVSIQNLFTFDFGGGNKTDPYNYKAKIEDLLEVINLFDYGSDFVAIIGDAGSVAQDNANTEAINILIQTTAVIVAARTVPDIDFSSLDDALKTQDKIISKLDEIIETTTDDNLYLDLIELKSNLVKNIEARSANLATVQRITPTASIPSLVLSHDLYGTITREADIISRNKISTPYTVAGGVEIEVLNANT